MDYKNRCRKKLHAMKTIKCHPSDAVKIEEFDTTNFLIKDEVFEYSIYQTFKRAPRFEMEEYILPENIKTEPNDELASIFKCEQSDRNWNSEQYILPGIVDNLDIKAEPKAEMCVFDVTTASLVEDQLSSSAMNTCTSLDSDSYSSFKDLTTTLEETDSYLQDTITSNYANSQTCPDTTRVIQKEHSYCVTQFTSSCEKNQETDNLASEVSSNEDGQLVNVAEEDIEEQTTDREAGSEVPLNEDDSSEEKGDDETGQATTSDSEYDMAQDFTKYRDEKPPPTPMLRNVKTLNTKGGTLCSEPGTRKSLEEVLSSNACTNFKEILVQFADPKQHKCNDSNFTTVSKQKLKMHIRTAGSSENPFNCDFCDYSSANKYNLNCHLIIHTGLKSHKCDFCNYACAYKYGMIRHARIHSGEKPFKCKQCDFACAMRSGLKNHEKVHSDLKPHKCEYCDYACKRKVSLIGHVRKHTGEKPFKCIQCDYTCARSESLYRHEKTHPTLTFQKFEYCDFTCSKK